MCNSLDFKIRVCRVDFIGVGYGVQPVSAAILENEDLHAIEGCVLELMVSVSSVYGIGLWE